ncbi:hypothetical protein ALQ09_200009 [Pseudomonas viridiflava]|nr:hypothetical protein ALQ09_200009 [Pseudomonas viridiflava]
MCLRAGFAIVFVELTVARPLYNLGAINTAIAGSQNGTDVLYRARRQAHAAVALNRRRTVDDAVGKGTLPVTVNREITQAIDVGVAVVQRTDPQAHVVATEDQPAVIDQRAGGHGQRLTTAQRALVVDAPCIDGQVTRRSQAADIAQLPPNRNRGVTAASDGRSGVEVHLRGTQSERPEAAETAIAAVCTADIEA